MTKQRIPARRRRIGWGVAAVVVGVGVFLFAATGCGGGESSDVPSFSADDLTETASDNWPTVGGSFANDRYSELDEITTDNVEDLQGVWKTDLRNSGTEAKYSGESQPVVYNGVIYVSTGMNDVFAVDVETGKILWQYKANLDQKITTVCCGWLNRGVAIGDGRVYQGQLDGAVVALDAKTGEQIWKRQLVRWQEGQTITAAPIYADGKIYLGVVGADLGTRALPRGDGRRDRRVRLALLHDPRSGPARRRLVAGGHRRVPARRRRGLAGARLRPRPRAPLLLDGQRRPGLGRQRPGRATTSGPSRSSRSRPTPARSSGATRWSTTTSGTSTPRARSCSSTPPTTARASRRRARPAGSTCSTARRASRSTGSTRQPVKQDPVQKTAATQPIPRNGEFIPHEFPTPQAEIDRITKSLTPEQKNLKVVPQTASTTRPAVTGRSSPSCRARRAASTGSRSPTTRRRTCSTSAPPCRRRARWRRPGRSGRRASSTSAA